MFKRTKKAKMFSKWMLSVFDFLREMNTFHVFVRFSRLTIML